MSWQHISRAAVTAAFLGLTGAAASAQEPPPADKIEESQQLEAAILAIEPAQIPLDKALVERVLDGYPKVAALARELDSSEPAPDASDIEENPAYLFAPHIADAKTAIRIEEMFRSIGFDNYSDWANAVHSIMLAADAASFQQPADLETQKAHAQDEIRNDTALNEAEKQAALADLEEEFTALAQFEPLPGNIEAVEPYLDRVREAGLGGVGEPGEE